ncbi:hypothetical protein LTS02_010790 [Friedmanniomyces endolithicus]|nr:hypothetical protein LTS02_010790 [Friedmanniomyces endolithicus]
MAQFIEAADGSGIGGNLAQSALSVPICAGLRLATINQRKLTNDPMLMLWLFTVLSQIHIFLSMLGGTSPALKKTMLDLVTNYGGVSDGEADSRAKAYGRSFPMKDMKSRQQSSQASTSKFVPFVGGASSNIATVKSIPDRGRVRKVSLAAASLRSATRAQAKGARSTRGGNCAYVCYSKLLFGVINKGESLNAYGAQYHPILHLPVESRW